MRLRRLAAVLVILLIAGCAGKAEKPPYAGIKLGKPYQVYGRWYKPSYDAHYDETGKASWYGPGFHGGQTANGEKYDQEELTGAHRTLPLPSIVRVTNLDNGKSALVRINDRGPFSHERIIDLSKSTARALDMIRNGTARVRVQFLEQETKDYVQATYGQKGQATYDKMRASDPGPMGEEATFYVMKVPVGDKPPPSSIPVSEEDAANYPEKDIFEVVDNETQEKAVSPRAARALTAQHPEVKAAQQHYLDQPKTRAVNNMAAQDDAEASFEAGYYAQAGTFGSRENAARLVASLGEEFHAKIVPLTTSNNRLFYRVMMGPYKASAEAKNMLSKLAAAGIPDAKIIRN